MSDGGRLVPEYLTEIIMERLENDQIPSVVEREVAVVQLVCSRLREMLDGPSGRELLGRLVAEAYDQLVRNEPRA